MLHTRCSLSTHRTCDTVELPTIALAEYDFWSYILRSTKYLSVIKLLALSVQDALHQVGCQIHDSHFTQTKVGQFNVTLVGD